MLKCSNERGAGGIFLFVVLLLATVFLAAFLTLSRTSTAIGEQTETGADLDRVAAALEQFVAINGRLPCPADPTLDVNSDTGVEAISGSTCKTGLAGTIPWKTIGLGRDDTFDAWGWRISYRVYSPAFGGLTQPTSGSSPTKGGASMVNCNTSPRFDAGVDANGFCSSNYLTSIDSFTTGKGLTVNEYTDVSAGSASVPTSVHTGVAYVLISHGQTGFGGYTKSGARRDLPANGPEHNNTDFDSNASPFVVSSVAPASSTDIAPSKKGHFDDIVRYRTILDLARRTGLAARPWSFALALQSALGASSPPTLGSNLNVSTLNFGGAQITAGSISGGSSNLSYDSAGGTEGVGVYGGGSGTAIAGTDYLTVTFAKSAGKVAISLAGFDRNEKATLAFLSGGSFVGSGVTLKGCQSSTPGGGPLASFTVDPGVTFDEIAITSWPYSSTFLLAAVKTCATTDSTCVTPLDNAGNHCS